MMPMFGDHTPFAYVHDKYSVRYPVFSPDSKWISYTSTEAGHPPAYAVASPTPGGKFLVVDGLGSQWSRNGREIIYVDDHNRIVSVAVADHGERRELGRAQAL